MFIILSLKYEQSFIINVIVYQYLRQCFDNKIRIGLSVLNQAIYYAKLFHLIVFYAEIELL